MVEVLWLGRGGQGAFTAARLLGMGTSLFHGRQSLSFPSFGPERRGAPVFSYTKISSREGEEVQDRSPVRQADWAVVLDETLLDDFPASFVKPGGNLLVNTPRDHVEVSGFVSCYPFDAESLAQETVGKPWVNMAMLGALSGLSGLLEPHAAAQAIEKEFLGDSALKNLRLFMASYALFEFWDERYIDGGGI